MGKNKAVEDYYRKLIRGGDVEALRPTIENFHRNGKSSQGNTIIKSI